MRIPYKYFLDWAKENSEIVWYRIAFDRLAKKVLNKYLLLEYNLKVEVSICPTLWKLPNIWAVKLE